MVGFVKGGESMITEKIIATMEFDRPCFYNGKIDHFYKEKVLIIEHESTNGDVWFNYSFSVNEDNSLSDSNLTRLLVDLALDVAEHLKYQN